MKSFNKHISLLLIFLAPILTVFGQEKSTTKHLDFSFGYKENNSNNNSFQKHSGKLIAFNYEYIVNDNNPTNFAINISNSNSKYLDEIEYISASTGIIFTIGKQLKVISKPLFNCHLGGFVNNNFQLNYFPRIDKDDFHWENTTNIGITNSNSFLLKSGKLKLENSLSIYSFMYFHQFDRLGETERATNNGDFNAKKGTINDYINVISKIEYEFQVFNLFKNGVFLRADYQGVKKEFSSTHNYISIQSGVKFVY